ncbi:flagellar hook-associated protein FlgK [Oribacterium sp. P6A1]|uniref:flagellar hook-associated protein FlgK n=1 Tax=Oribacterium sp. P6A1 TaxID=1410612 RepID=UPI00055D398C|nr:flagellar basal body protein [Oribacterium sp. P6A1]
MVRATFAGFQTALTSLQANSKKLDVTSQNLANMNVEGYTRQQLKTSSVNYENPVSFYMNENDVNVGFGVSMDEVLQIRDKFLDIQYRDQNTATNYNTAIEESLNSLSRFMDETTHDGLRASLDAIQTALTTMQDTSKVQDPVYEGQLQSDMNATAVLLNSAARQIKTAEDNEFEKLYGKGTSGNGAVETINTLLSEIGDLNNKIKHNQLIGNPALELQDERNLKIDELSKYIPITVEYYSEEYTVAGETNPRYRIYTYDANGNPCGRADWPEDLRITLNFTKKDGTQDSIILVNGTYKDANGLNYGSVDLLKDKTKVPSEPYYSKWSDTTNTSTNPLDTQLVFTSAGTKKDGTKTTPTDVITANSQSDSSSGHITFSGGSVQAGLDMLAKSDPSKTATTGLKQGIYYGFDYYMDQLDNLAQTLADEMNTYNHMGNTWNYPYEPEETAKANSTTAIKANGTTDHILLVNRSDQTGNDINAENISLSKKWVNGETKIGLRGSDSNLTILNMINSFTQPHSELKDKTFANYMNSLSTRLANDQESNKDSLDTNTNVLNSITSAKDQLSGVSLDEEAANMMIYVSSYNAAAKIMTAFDETLQTLLGLV